MPTHTTMFVTRRNSNQTESEVSRLCAPYTNSSVINAPMSTDGPNCGRLAKVPGSDNVNQQHPQQQQQHQQQQQQQQPYHIVTPGSASKPVGMPIEQQYKGYNNRATSSTGACGDNNSNPYYGNTAPSEGPSHRPSPHSGHIRYPPPLLTGGSSTNSSRNSYGDANHEESRYHGHHAPPPQRHHRQRAPFFPPMHESPHPLPPQHAQQHQQHQQQQHHPVHDKSSSIPYSTLRSRSFDEYGHEPPSQHSDRHSRHSQHSERHSQHSNHPHSQHNSHARIPTSYPYQPTNHHTVSHPNHPHNDRNEPQLPPLPLNVPPQQGHSNHQQHQQRQPPHPNAQPRFRLSPQRRPDAPRPSGPPMLSDAIHPPPRIPPTGSESGPGAGRVRHHPYDQHEPMPPHPQMLQRRNPHHHHNPQQHLQQHPPMPGPKHSTIIEQPTQPQIQPAQAQPPLPTQAQAQPMQSQVPTQPNQPQVQAQAQPNQTRVQDQARPTQPQPQAQTLPTQPQPVQPQPVQPQPTQQVAQTQPTQQPVQAQRNQLQPPLQQVPNAWNMGRDTTATTPIQHTNSSLHDNVNTNDKISTAEGEVSQCPPGTIRKSSCGDIPLSPSSVSTVSQVSVPSKESCGNESEAGKVTDSASNSSNSNSNDNNKQEYHAETNNDIYANVPEEEDEKEMINDALLLAEVCAMARSEVKKIPATVATGLTPSEIPTKQPVATPSNTSIATISTIDNTTIVIPSTRKISPVNDLTASNVIDEPVKYSGTIITSTIDVSSPTLSLTLKNDTECTPITPSKISQSIATSNPSSSPTTSSTTVEGTDTNTIRRTVSGCGADTSNDESAEATEATPRPLVLPRALSHYNNIKDDEENNNTNHEDSSHETTETQNLTPAARNRLLPRKCLQINNGARPPPPPLTLRASNTRALPPGGPHRGAPPYPMTHGFKPENGGCNDVPSSSSRGGFPAPNMRSGSPRNHRFDCGGSGGSSHNEQPHLQQHHHQQHQHQQQHSHGAEDQWNENRGPPPRISVSDPRGEYDYENAHHYRHPSRRVHPGPSTGEVGRVSLTPPPSHSPDESDQLYHLRMQHQQQKQSYYNTPGNHNEGEHEGHYSNNGDYDYGHPSSKSHVQFTNRPRDRLYSGNDLSAMNSRDEYDEESYYPPPPYPSKQQHRAPDQDRNVSLQQQQRPPSSNSHGNKSGGGPPPPPPQHRYYSQQGQQDSYSPRSAGSGPPLSRQLPTRCGSYSSIAAPPPPIGRTGSQEYYLSPGASGTLLSHRGHPRQHRGVGHGGQQQQHQRDHMPPMMDSGSGMGNGIKRQFETPITPGTGGKALDGSSGPQIIGEGALSSSLPHTGMSGCSSGVSIGAGQSTSGPSYDEYRHSPSNWNGHHPSQQPSGGSGHRSSAMKKTILRRKCAWKNYPELEAFLISNREEYLRHSAMNYTVQQKQYNNRLTERLLEVAANNNYVFDENDFNFVAVRDRIRCYYKSYVQSSKKRGIIVGYSAQQQVQQNLKKQKLSSEMDANINLPDDDSGGVGVGAIGTEEASTNNSNSTVGGASKEQSEQKEQIQYQKMTRPHVNTDTAVPKPSSNIAGNADSLPPTKSIAV